MSNIQAPNAIPETPVTLPKSQKITPTISEMSPDSPGIVPYTPDFNPISPGTKLNPSISASKLSDEDDDVQYYLDLLDKYEYLNPGNIEQYSNIIKQFILNGEDKNISNEDELVEILINKYADFRNAQKGGNMTNVYTIHFTDLEYNSIYLFSRINFIGYYLTEQLYYTQP